MSAAKRGYSMPADQTLAHDDMRRKVFHHDHRLLTIEVEDLRRQARRVAALLDERVVFEPRPLERQRPGFADEAHIGQGLLDHDAAGRPLDDEDEIEVAVADLAHAPSAGSPPSLARRSGKPARIGKAWRRRPAHRLRPSRALARSQAPALRGARSRSA